MGNLSDKYGKNLMETTSKTRLDDLKTASKKAAKAMGEFTGNKITDKIVKPKPVSDTNFRNV